MMLTRFGGVLCIIEDQHITGGGLGGNDARILRHVAGPVHFSFMVDLDLNLYFATYRPKASKLWNKTDKVIVANGSVV